LTCDGAILQSNDDKNHSSNLVLFGKFINEFDIQSHEFESSIVRLDTAFFKLANVRLKENAKFGKTFSEFDIATLKFLGAILYPPPNSS
jgi:hypothetical protein